MRMLDEERNIAIDNLILYLKKAEAVELYNALETLIESEDYSMHLHVSEETYQREVTVVLYDDSNIETLNDRSKKIILEDE